MSDLTIGGLAASIYQNAREKGFWPDVPRIGDIPEKIALMHSELSEALEEYRNHRPSNSIYWKDGKPEGIPIEMADLIIRALDFCKGYNIDIEEAIRIKMEYNAGRPHKHGKRI